ncbi:hypothetical protein CWI75_09610 [Kineobactrum sediminis]|uniref:AB hydrolase-1 domain-containing protein n=1 Tax=Kineobactrum sediminis TaxID=1905677 RepID=A0A2N5Y335_9GAMM|nr:alpha/beta fold hydrolase [Kineobactrum sediminis]PLW82812.1 hypothetical protein CWI75_09610 [Kineobactrum sediminis]
MVAEVFDSVAGDGPDVVLMHGLFGSGNNLGSLSRSLQDRYRVHSLDLPNHGRSAWMPDMALGDLAAAVQHWMTHRGLETAHFVGHSLGGKVAMQLALDAPYCVDALVVADIAPVAYPPGHDAVFAALAAVAEAQCHSRQEAAELMTPFLKEESTIQFLLTSLQRASDGTCHWRFNLPVLRDHYSDVLAEVPAQEPFDGRVLFVKGEASDYIQEQHEEAIRERFPRAEIEVIPDSGHWLHAQQPRLFNTVVGRFLDA